MKAEGPRARGGPPRITVVTPSLNQGEFLEESIRSVLGQGYPNLEYIVMDRGSSGGSVEIIRRYEAHLAHWESRPDGGPYAAVAAGFRHASGDILCWLNADDRFHPMALWKVAYVFVQRPEALWITGRPTILGRDGRLAAVRPLRARARREFLAFARNATPFIQQESTFWRRELWERAGGEFRADLRLAAGFELWLRFFRLAPLVTVDALLGGFRKHGVQRSVLQRAEYLAEVERVVREERERWPWGTVPADRREPSVIRIEPRELWAWLGRVGCGGAGPAGELDAERERIVDFLLQVHDALRAQNEALRTRLRVLGVVSEALRRLGRAVGLRWPAGGTE